MASGYKIKKNYNKYGVYPRGDYFARPEVVVVVVEVAVHRRKLSVVRRSCSCGDA